MPAITPFRSLLSFTAASLLAALLLTLPASASASQTLTVQKAGAGNGTLTSSPSGISCGSECKASFPDNASVTISATPDPGSQAAKWSGCDSVNGEGKCEVTMSSAKSVTATFDLLQRQLTVKKAGTATGTVTSSPAGIECGKACTASYLHGTTVTLTGTPGPLALPAKWSGCGFVDPEDHCIVAMSSAREVTAAFDLSEPLLKVNKAGTGTGTVKSSPSGIDCGSTCTAKYLEGTTVTLSGVPSGEAEAPLWSGCDSVTAEGKCVVKMSAAREVTASFELPVFGLSVIEVGNGTGTVTSTPAGIECPSASCSHSFIKGSTVALKATPGTHTEAVQWAGCDKLTVKGECLVAISQAKAVIATFDIQPAWAEYTVFVQKTGDGSGTVQSAPGGIECGEDCAGTYLHFTALTLSATPAPGSELDHWSVSACGSSASCQIAVNASRTVRAVFVAVGTRTLTLARAGTGTGTVTSKPAAIDCGPTCSAELEAGTKVTLKASAAPGSSFSGWNGEGCSGTSTCRVTMTEARSITASFAKPPPGPSELLVAGRARVKAGRALLRLACEGQSPCNGSLRLLLKVRNAQGQTKGLVIAQGSFSLTAGARQTLEVKLSPRARRLLGGAESLRARVTGTGIDSHAIRLSA